MNAEWPAERFRMVDQLRPPGYRKRYRNQSESTIAAHRARQRIKIFLKNGSAYRE
jgi:hypothetical protein